MVNRFQEVFIPACENVEDLRKSIEKSLNRSIAMFNRPTEIYNAKSKRISNVGWPTTLQDAVTVEYLDKQLSNSRADSTSTNPFQTYPIGVSGTDAQTLRYKGSVSDWVASSELQNDGTNIKVNGGALLQFDYGATPDFAQFHSEGSEGTKSASLDTDVIGRLSFYGYGATNYHPDPTAKIEAHAAADFTDSNGETDLVFYATPATSITAAEVMRITGTGKVAIGTSVAGATLDVAGMIRTIAGVNPVGGAGLELSYQSNESFVTSYNRTAGTRSNLKIAGALTIVNAEAGAGNVLIGSVTNNTNGGKLQVTGGASPAVDGSGGLGTPLVQWDDIYFKGDIVQGTNTRINTGGSATFDTVTSTGGYIYGAGTTYKVYLPSDAAYLLAGANTYFACDTSNLVGYISGGRKFGITSTLFESDVAFKAPTYISGTGTGLSTSIVRVLGTTTSTESYISGLLVAIT